MELVIVTGLSGAGKSRVIDALEDLGYFCVDNVPPLMLEKFAQLGRTSQGNAQRMAMVVDARGGAMFADFTGALERLRAEGYSFRLLFLDADDETLLRRYQEGRRRHPLLERDALTIEDAIRKERELLWQARQQADLVFDTSLTTPAQLRERVAQTFLSDPAQGMVTQCISFGFKNGLPKEADLVFDVRCLPNPFYVPELREHTGLEAPVRDYMMAAPESQELLRRLLELVDFLLPLYQEEGKSQLTIAVGCTGGRHRSVAFAQAIGEHLRAQGSLVAIIHRDKDRTNHGSGIWHPIGESKNP